MMNMESVNRLMMSGVESAAQMSIGQAVLRMVDKVMWIIEKSVQWSLPAPETVTEENGKSFGKPELVRPLPWIVFLPTILMLRVFRASLNTIAMVLGYPTVQPSDMIRVIQRGRRRLRAIKSSGLKNIRQKKTPATKSTPVPEGKMKDEDELLSPKGDIKRKHSELSDESSEDESGDENMLSKIDRLAEDSGSDNDRDYNPNESTTSDLSDSVGSADTSISMSEVQELNGDVDQLIVRDSPEKAKVQLDSEMNKSSNEAETDKNLQVMERPQDLPVSGWENGSEEVYYSGNGVGGDTDTAYYSPISWKSISPELSPDTRNNQIDDRKPEELNNGEVNKKEKKDHDRNEASVESDETLANGLTKEKQKSSSHSGGSQKHHKHKRGNHGHRKKK